MGSWFSRIAIFLVATAVLIFTVVWSVGYISQSINKHYAVVNQVNAAYQKNAERDRQKASDIIAQTCRGGNFLVFRQCIRNKLEAYYRNQATNEDLKAQKDMALWAYYLFWTSVAGIAVSIFGLDLLGWSLFQTRKALKDGRETAKAAQLSNEIMQNEQRPWLTFEYKRGQNYFNLEPMEGPDGAKFIARVIMLGRFKNYGRTPAIKIKFHYELLVTEGLISAKELVDDFYDRCISNAEIAFESTNFPSVEPDFIRHGTVSHVDFQSNPGSDFTLLIGVTYQTGNPKKIGVEVRAFYINQEDKWIGPAYAEFGEIAYFRIVE